MPRAVTNLSNISPSQLEAESAAVAAPDAVAGTSQEIIVEPFIFLHASSAHFISSFTSTTRSSSSSSEAKFNTRTYSHALNKRLTPTSFLLLLVSTGGGGGISETTGTETEATGEVVDFEVENPTEPPPKENPDADDADFGTDDDFGTDGDGDEPNTNDEDDEVGAC